MRVSIQKIKGWALKDSPIMFLREYHNVEKNIKKELYALNVNIENIYVDDEIIEIKFPFLNQKGEKYVLNCADIGVVCEYLGTYSYELIGDYGITLRFEYNSYEETDEIKLIRKE